MDSNWLNPLLVHCTIFKLLFKYVANTVDIKPFTMRIDHWQSR